MGIKSLERGWDHAAVDQLRAAAAYLVMEGRGEVG